MIQKNLKDNSIQQLPTFPKDGLTGILYVFNFYQFLKPLPPSSRQNFIPS